MREFATKLAVDFFSAEETSSPDFFLIAFRAASSITLPFSRMLKTCYQHCITVQLCLHAFVTSTLLSSRTVLPLHYLLLIQQSYRVTKYWLSSSLISLSLSLFLSLSLSCFRNEIMKYCLGGLTTTLQQIQSVAAKNKFFTALREKNVSTMRRHSNES